MKKILLTFCVCVFAFSNSLSDIVKDKEIKIGVRKHLPPFSLYEDGNFEGFEVELAKKIGEHILGKTDKVKLVPVEAKDRVPMLQDGSVDLMVANFTKTKEREKLVDFSTPYLLDYMGIVSSKKHYVYKLCDAKGARILVIKGTTSDEYLKADEELSKNLNIVYCDTLRHCTDMLFNGEAEAYFHTVFALGVIPLLNDSFEFTATSVGVPGYIAVGIQKGNVELRKKVDEAILKISKEGFFEKAYDKTFKLYYKDTLDRKLFFLDNIYNYFSYAG